MGEVTLVAGEGDRDLRERLDQEIIAFNVAATGYRDARLLSIAARGDSGDLCAGLSGWTWGGCGHLTKATNPGEVRRLLPSGASGGRRPPE